MRPTTAPLIALTILAALSVAMNGSQQLTVGVPAGGGTLALWLAGMLLWRRRRK
jgi:hypothetical protein